MTEFNTRNLFFLPFLCHSEKFNLEMKTSCNIFWIHIQVYVITNMTTFLYVLAYMYVKRKQNIEMQPEGKKKCHHLKSFKPSFFKSKKPKFRSRKFWILCGIETYTIYHSSIYWMNFKRLNISMWGGIDIMYKRMFLTLLQKN